MGWGRCYLSRQVCGKAANPLHILINLQSFKEKSDFFLVRCESHCPVCFLSLLFSTRRVLYGHPLGSGPAAKPIRLECCSRLSVVAGRACFQTWMAVWVSLIPQVQQHRCAGCRVYASRMVALFPGSFSRPTCVSCCQPLLFTPIWWWW